MGINKMANQPWPRMVKPVLVVGLASSEGEVIIKEMSLWQSTTGVPQALRSVNNKYVRLVVGFYGSTFCSTLDQQRCESLVVLGDKNEAGIIAGVGGEILARGRGARKLGSFTIRNDRIIVINESPSSRFEGVPGFATSERTEERPKDTMCGRRCSGSQVEPSLSFFSSWINAFAHSFQNKSKSQTEQKQSHTFVERAAVTTEYLESSH